MKVCRLCLFKDDENQIFSVWDNEEDNLAAKIKLCVAVNITEDDTLPTSACLSCIEKVTQWEMFYNLCQKSNEILLKDLLATTNKLDECYEREIEKHQQSVVDNAESDEDVSIKEDMELKPDFLEQSFKSDFYYNTYECEICLREFDNCFEYIDHQNTHNGQPVFQCDKCTEIFITRQSLVEHDKHHRTPCPQCGKMILEASMKLHLIKHTDKHKCLQCNGRFNSKAALGQHIVTVHTNIRDHICETCGKRFSSQTAMRVHMRSHSDERLYPCKLCNYAGRTASAVYVHMSTHANDIYVCEICSKTFKSNRNLSDHLRRVHSKIKKHHCTYCDKKFVDKYMLKVHIRCHTGVRPYQCDVCGKAFIRSDGLREHMAIHSQRIPYDCPDCGKKFTSKRGVTRHTCASFL